MEKPIKSFEELMKHPECVQALERKISDFTIKKFLIKRETEKLKEEEERFRVEAITLFGKVELEAAEYVISESEKRCAKILDRMSQHEQRSGKQD